ncbi:protein YohP [Atlantibacter hermannii]|uniref:Protein YohP n=2 Tax=Atlantibacter subterraneus TaxID=255519 RepID=A0A427V6Z7_9ENTR|nr:protein YohP [Atlantibacter hermannii]QFH70681.1 protein YohP [Enterobacter sp. E76]RSB65209.1 protein YohP [Atlantibacter subterranea]RSE08736.1 protein YohP [Atlantibacter subterranea]RSE28537.1 protein YohP [Atlantibacter subterranea]
MYWLLNRGKAMKIILWAVLIIFLIGLLVVTGVFKAIF